MFLGLVFLGCQFAAISAQRLGDCDFDGGMCLWTNAKGEDDFDWTRKKDRTLSRNTGPDADHTGSGYYLYIETSWPRLKGQVARLLSPRMQGPQCMTLWYHMYGADMGHMAIYSNSSGLLRLLWLKGGEHGTYWYKAFISIQETGEYKVEIEGVCGKSFHGDAAIDDIVFHPGDCKEQAYSVLYSYADELHHGRLHQQGLPSSAPRSFQYLLHLQQEPFDNHDQFYLVCQGTAGLRIRKTEYTPRKPFPCEPTTFFYSSTFNRGGLYPFFVLNRGNSTPEIMRLMNDTIYCSGSSSVIQLFATAIDHSVNLAHNSSANQSSHVAGFPASFAIDGDHKTCAKTPKQDNPWLEIKLDDSRFIYKVYVTTRHNCSHGDRLPNITVTIYDQNVQVSCQTTDLRGKKMSRVFLCQPPLRAHKLRIEDHGKQTTLSLCEVIVNSVDSLEQLRGVRAETWTSIGSSGYLERFLKNPKRFDSPDISTLFTKFSDFKFRMDAYGQRLTAFAQPPEDGNYEISGFCLWQCGVWVKALQNFSDISFFEDLEPKEEWLFKISGFSFQTRTKDLDSCRMFMVETVQAVQRIGFIHVACKTPSGQINSPLNVPRMFWLLPGLQMLNITLFEPSMKQSVGQIMKILMSYRLCCHGIYCPSCTKTVRLQLLGRTFMVNSSLSNTCQWYNYTTSMEIVNHPGKYDIKVFESTSNTSLTSRSIGDIEIKARDLLDPRFNPSCTWKIKGWAVVQDSDNKVSYFEAQANTTAQLQSPDVPLRRLYQSIGLCLVFRYRNNHESSQLKIIINPLYNRTVLWHLEGMQGTHWKEARIPWPGNTPRVMVKIQGKADKNGSVAVSDICLLTIKCTLTPNHAAPGHTCAADEFRCHNGECVKSTLRCDGDYACVDNSDERSCPCKPSEYQCPDGTCLGVSGLCNGKKECADGSDEASCGNLCKENQFSCFDGSCVPFSATCNGALDCKDGSDEPDVCSSLRCPLNIVSCTNASDKPKEKKCRTFREPCTFDYGFCGLKSASTNQSSSKAKWQINKGPTPTPTTGPSVDHTTLSANGSYLYLEVSRLNKGDAAELRSDWLEYDNVTCLQFWYHMWGRHVGALNVYVITNHTKYKVWSRTGDAGARWRFGQTSIDSNGSNFKFIFEATAGDDNKGDIAIDDVNLITGKCDLSILDLSNCDFEDGFCNWKNNAVWISKIYPKRARVPIRDKKMFESPVIDPREGLKCLRFWFFMNSTTTIQLFSTNVSDGRRTSLWNNTKLTKSWSFVQIPFYAKHKYKLSFEAGKPGITTVNITLSRDSCQRASSINENCQKRTTKGDCCVFPFVYRGRCYSYCIGGGGAEPWCSLTENYDRDGQKGSCGGTSLQDTPTQCRVRYDNQKPAIHWTPIRGLSSNATWSPRMPNSDGLVKEDNTSKAEIDLQASLFEIVMNGSTKGLRSLNIPDLETFTACIWMKTSDTENQGTPFKYQYNSAGFGLFDYKNMIIRLMGKEENASVSANDGRWHHLCLVWTSKGGVYEMYKDGKIVTQGYDWHKDKKIPGHGRLSVGRDGFVGKMSGMNLWTVAMSRSEIARRAVGCGMETGDIVDWSSFGREYNNVISPPTCLNPAGEKGYNIVQNSTNQITGDLVSNVFNSSIADYSISFCLYFRFLMAGQLNASLKIYRSDLKDSNTNTSNEELAWSGIHPQTNLPLSWRFGAVSLSTTQSSFKIRISATLGPGQGTIGLAGYYTKPGYCPSFSVEEKRGCNVDLTRKTGTFSSPYFPDPYPNDIQCKWLISRPTGHVIRLQLLAFQLQYSRSCENDYVVVYDGDSTSSPVLGRYCGDSFPLLLQSSSNALVIVFKTDDDVSFSGFKMSYTSYIKEKEKCNLIKDCPSSCSCSALPGNPPPVAIHCEEMTAIPMKIPVNTVAMMMSRNRLLRVEYSKSDDLQYMDLSHNRVMSVTRSGLNKLTTLRLDFNFIKALEPNVFTGLSRLEMLDLGYNLLGVVKNKSLYNLQNLRVLGLRSNQISQIEIQAFRFVKNLTHLYIQNNLLEALPDGVFENLGSLRVLYLNNNKLKKVSRDTFRNLRSLEELYLDKNYIQTIDETTFSQLQSLRLLKLDRFIFCCYAASSIKDLKCVSPSSAFSSCDDLMKNKTLQVCIWILGILAFVGNIGVIIWRLVVKERNRVHSFLLTNLAVSDLMMGVYLLMIAMKDREWRGEYFKHDLQWRSSFVCQLAGALSVISSEVSVLILTTITADRYATIVFAFKFKKLKMKSAVFVVSLIWIFGMIIALFPMLYTDYFYDNDWQVGFYGKSGVCLPLQLSQELFPGWEYSVAIFIGLNFVAFTFILVAYIIMFWKVRSAGRSVRSTQMNIESAMARKMAFIIMTDFCCWMPIIVIGVLSLIGQFPDPEKLAYVWIAVFVLPVNSSINPVLYTFSNRSSCGRKKSVLSSFKSRFTRGIVESPIDHIPLSTYPSVIFKDASLATTVTLASEPCSKDIRKKASENLKMNVVKTNLFYEEITLSVRFYRGFNDDNEEVVLLFKHFGNGERAEWNREVEVIDRLRKDGGHPNVLKHLWYSQVQGAPVVIDLSNHDSLQSHDFLICYDLVSCTNTLEEYLSKSEADLSTQILLAIATDVINALSYLERCDVKHNHVTAQNILIKDSFMVPSLEAVLGGFGHATFVDAPKTTSVQDDNNPNNDITQYGTFVDELLTHSPNADPDNQIKEIATRCLKESNSLTAAAVRSMIEEVWDGTGTWDTLL